MPPGWYWLSLLFFAVAALALRLVLRRPLLPRWARVMGRANIGLASVAALALGFHCGAMFFTDEVALLPGVDGAISAITALGLTSKIVYAVPSALLVVALRPIWRPPLIACASALFTVGLTMYWWFGLWVHLTTIAVSFAALAVIASSLVRVGDGRPTGSRARRPAIGQIT